ncbi:MAG: hypothetical protein M1815_001469 [Lichina confinis]|nr:MAG: hypothetical protein M1815_001469 [Lichina confinis]
MLTIPFYKTFYLPVDLSSASLPLKRIEKGQGGGRKDSQSDTARAASDDSSPPQHEDFRDEEIGIGEREHGPGDSETPVDEGRIQILDLHSANPIISYRNQIYSCSWASNIGTELLLTDGSQGSHYPALLSKPDYTLLAASSFRLVSEQAQLAQKTSRTTGQRADVESTGLEQEQYAEGQIPVGPGALPSRYKQARFLERLMESKKRKGEQDEVTVYARKRYTGTGWRSQYNHHGAQEDEEPSSPPFGEEHVSTHNWGISRQPVSTASRGPRLSANGRPLGRPRGSKASRLMPQVQGMERLFRAPGGRAGRRETSSPPVQSFTPRTWDELEVSSSPTEHSGQA